MALRLEQERMRVDVLVGEGSVQAVAEGSLSLPADRPEVQRALRVQAFPRLERVVVEADRVMLEGSLDVQMLYAGAAGRREADSAQGPPERLHKVTWRKALTFAQVAEVPGAAAGMRVRPQARVESVSAQVSDGRTLDVEAVVDLQVRVYDQREVRLSTRVLGSGRVDTETRRVRVQQVVGEARTAGEARGRLPLAPPAWRGGEPSRLIDLTGLVRLARCEAGQGEVTVSGTLDCEALLAVADEMGGEVVQRATWSDGLAFAITVPVAGARPGQRVRADVELRGITAHVESGEHGAEIEASAALDVSVAAVEEREVTVVTGLFGSDGTEVAVRAEPLSLWETVGERTELLAARQALELPSGLPPIDRLLSADATPVLGDVHVLGDRVAVTGHVNLAILYVGRAPEGDVLSAATWPEALAFDGEVPIEGGEPGMDREITLRVTEVALDLLNRETVEAQVRLAVTARLAREVNLDAVVEAVEVPAPDPDPPTLTFVVVQEGDTLWKLAQQYRTDLDSILAANVWLQSIDQPLEPGRKLCIPRSRLA